MTDSYIVTQDKLIILERLMLLNYIDNFMPCEHTKIVELRKMNLLENRPLPALLTNDMGSRVVCYSKALQIRSKLSRLNVFKCCIKGHKWWGGQAPWLSPLGSIPMAGYCERCGVYVDYVGKQYDWEAGKVPRDENGHTVCIDYDSSEWRWL